MQNAAESNTPATPADAEPSQELDRLHHVAVCVADVAEAVRWYTQTLRCQVAYQDETWALLRLANIHLALVAKGGHPPHVGIFRDDAARFGELKPHRDGTRSVYIEDPSGNYVEFLTEK